MSEPTVNIEGAVCAPPLTHNEQIVMGHGAGGRMSHQLIQKAFMSAFDNPALRAGDDAARRAAELIVQLAGGELAEGVLSAGAPVRPATLIELRPSRCARSRGAADRRSPDHR